MELIKADYVIDELPLIEPYELSFGSVTKYQSAFFRVETSQNTKGIGEATPLPGYSGETIEDVIKVMEDAKCALQRSMNFNQAIRYVDDVYREHPFAASAIGCAVEEAFGVYSIPESLMVPLLMPISASRDTKEILLKVNQARSDGFGTIKVKIGREFDADISTAKALLKSDLGVSFRFDANQGYSLGLTRRWLDCVLKLRSDNWEYLEQPLPANDWDSLAILCEQYPNKILLDESIFDVNDVEMASHIGAGFIKLKLFKTKGMRHLLQISRRAKELGLKVVLGNGVATDVCNVIEAMAFSGTNELYHGAFEGNGFAKLDKRIVYQTLQQKNGWLVM